MTQDKAPELVERLKAQADHCLAAFGCEEYLPMGEFWQSQADILLEAALALSAAYERGQVDMRERAARVAFGRVHVTRGMAAQRACYAIQDAIRSLPIDGDGKDA